MYRFLIAFFGFSAAAAPQKLTSKRIDLCGRKTNLEIARTTEERSIGLMERDSIAAGTGMVFIFEEPQKLYFWMKNVPFDIDIGFFDANGRLQRFLTMAGSSPLMREEALPRYEGPEKSVYAVETPKGFFKKSDLKSCRMKPLP